MSKKKFAWLSALIGGLETIAVGTVTYFEPANSAAINSAIVVICTAITTAMSKFITPDQPEQ